MVALLRGINVGGHKKVPMAALRALAQGLGYADVETYIQSGNLVLSANDTTRAVEAALERAIHAELGVEVPVIVRAHAEWQRYAEHPPFSEAVADRPQLLLLGVAKLPLRRQVAQELAPYQTQGERILCLSDALWVDFVAGSARSKLTPAVLDRTAGSPVTTRNLRTVQTLAAMLRERA